MRDSVCHCAFTRSVGWARVGCELIHHINNEEDRRRSPKRLLNDSLDEEGGPLCRHAQQGTELQQYETTRKKPRAFRSARSPTHEFR